MELRDLWNILGTIPLRRPLLPVQDTIREAKRNLLFFWCNGDSICARARKELAKP